jgi:uncharacterized membrane protein|tara:strand:+ start:475 stop:723 length:249 start_codon:yes stop_codon:yes gene_type:complete
MPKNHEEWQIAIFVLSMIIATLIGICFAIYYWNDPKVESTDIFYLIFGSWMFGPILLFLVIPLCIVFELPRLIIEKFRKLKI